MIIQYVTGLSWFVYLENTGYPRYTGQWGDGHEQDKVSLEETRSG